MKQLSLNTFLNSSDTVLAVEAFPFPSVCLPCGHQVLGTGQEAQGEGFNTLWVLAPSLEGTHGVSSGLVGLWSWEIEVVKGRGKCGGQ